MRSGTVPERPDEVLLWREEAVVCFEDSRAEYLRRLEVEGTNWSKGTSSSASDKSTGTSVLDFMIADFEDFDNPEGPGTSFNANGVIDSDLV